MNDLVLSLAKRAFGYTAQRLSDIDGIYVLDSESIRVAGCGILRKLEDGWKFYPYAQ